MSIEISQLRGALNAHEKLCDQRHKTIDDNFQRTSNEIRDLKESWRWGIGVIISSIVLAVAILGYLNFQTTNTGPGVYQAYEITSKVTDE